MQCTGIELKDGIQTNLTCNTSKIDALYTLFNERVGTSIDNNSNKRTIKGSADLYRSKFKKNLIYLDSKHKPIPAVIVIDKDNCTQMIQEYIAANKVGREIVFKPIFSGAEVTNDTLSKSEMIECYKGLYNEWFLKGSVRIEPFYSITQRRLRVLNGYKCGSYCAWQSNCLSQSVNIDPDGSIYVCQEMSDKQFGLYGNALSRTIDLDTYRKLARRSLNVGKQCNQCQFFEDCQGGCMIDNIESNKSIQDKSINCDVWYSLFSMVTKKIESSDQEQFTTWLERI